MDCPAPKETFISDYRILVATTGAVAFIDIDKIERPKNKNFFRDILSLILRSALITIPNIPPQEQNNMKMVHCVLFIKPRLLTKKGNQNNRFYNQLHELER